MFKGLKVVNLTPNPVRVIGEDGTVIAEWESAGSLRIRYAYENYAGCAVRSAQVAGIDELELAEGADVVIVSRSMAMLPGLTSALVMYPDAEVRYRQDGRIVRGWRYLTTYRDPFHQVGLENVLVEGVAFGLSDTHTVPNAIRIYNDAVSEARKGGK